MISKKDLNQGYKKYSNDSESKLNTTEKINNQKVKEVRYPHGYFTVLFISLITIGVFLLNYFLNWITVDVVASQGSQEVIGQETINVQRSVTYCLAVAFTVGFLLNVVWLISRQLFSLKIKYTSRKMMEILTFKNQRKKRNLTFSTLAVNNINSFYDYQKFCEMKKLTTSLVFWISFTIYTICFIVTTIISFVL
ncbi:MAG: hypothetical protein K2I67_01945 [Malacoplasma sp.]|nr:hypothetical protein [Malacoplasma sp.]